MGSALQIFLNLDNLNQIVSSVNSKLLSDINGKIKDSLDPSKLVEKNNQEMRRPGVVQRSGDTIPKKAFFSNLEEMFNFIQNSYKQVWNLQRVLQKKKDPSTQICFADLVTEV